MRTRPDTSVLHWSCDLVSAPSSAGGPQIWRSFTRHTLVVPISDDRFSVDELRERDIVRRAIGRAIRTRREAAGLTQQEVALASNISSRELRRIEGGKGGMQLDRLWSLAKALGCQPADLVTDAQQNAATEHNERFP